MRLPKRIAAVGTAGLIAGAFAGAPAAPAAQNYAPQCEATANLILVGLKIDYNIQCTDFNDSQTVTTAGDNNQGNWEAKSYPEASWVLYTNGKWYKAALDVTAADEPTVPQKDSDGNDLNVWIEQTSTTAAAWSTTSTAGSTVAGSFPSGYVVSKSISGTTHYFKANADAVVDNVPGVSSTWDDLGTSAYKGPQPPTTKTLAVKYPALVSGYSVLVLNNEVDGFETEPAVLTADKSGPAINQTQFCNGDHPGSGVSCSLQSGVNVYGVKNSDSSYIKLTGATLAVKNSDSTYTDLKSTGLYGDNSLTGSPAVTSASTDFLSLGALGFPTNSGKRIMPATSGSNITGQLEITTNPCVWGGDPVKLVAITADPEGQVNTPIAFEVPTSKYFKLIGPKGKFVEYHLPAGCVFHYSSTSPQVYYYEGETLRKLTKPARGQLQRVTAVE